MAKPGLIETNAGLNALLQTRGMGALTSDYASVVAIEEKTSGTPDSAASISLGGPEEDSGVEARGINVKYTAPAPTLIFIGTGRGRVDQSTS